MKIISLVPSQSELLWHLGLRQELVGITKFCIHPGEMFRSVTRVGGTKTVNIDTVRSLKPDLIVANREENEREQIETLQKEFRVHVTDIYTLPDALNMIREVSTLVNKTEEGKKLVAEIENKFAELHVFSPRKKAIYLIWKNPYMAAGPNTFIDDMLLRAGFENIVTEPRYPEISIEQIKTLNPEVVLLSSEPYPFKEKHIEEFKQAGLRAQVVDGEMFSWYGSRLLQAPAYFTAVWKKTI